MADLHNLRAVFVKLKIEIIIILILVIILLRQFENKPAQCRVAMYFHSPTFVYHCGKEVDCPSMI